MIPNPPFLGVFIMSRTSNTEEFIRKARSVHGDRYDYSEAVYVRAMSKVAIICKEHGVFWQTPNGHLGGHRCPICANKNTNRQRQNECRDRFTEKARKIHGDRYDYSEVDYKMAVDKVVIICKKHGQFLQSPNSHLNGSGCDECVSDRLREDRRFTKEQFVQKARLVHGDRYQYDLVDYFNARRKVDIICKKHGVFKQAPHLHLRGEHCPRCKRESSGEQTIAKILDDKGICYEREKTFPTCRFKKLLKFDFYIPSLNILIEYHGRQHYEVVEHWGGLAFYLILKTRDEYKKRWANDNNFIFIEVSCKQSWGQINRIITRAVI